MAGNPVVTAALTYVFLGLRVFPIGRNKKPCIKKWPELATTDEAQVHAWWREFPTANVAILTGDGHVALDADAKAGGIEALAQLEADVGELNTWRHTTPNAGIHLVFRIPPGCEIRNAAKLGEYNLEVKGVGGSLTVSPSFYADGRCYRDVDGCGVGTLSECPPALLELLKTNSAGKRKAKAAATEDAEGLIGEGARNTALASFAGKLRALGFDGPTLTVALLAENARRCDPPLPEAEVRAIAESVAHYPAETKRCTDLGNAERLAAAFAGRLLHVEPWRRWMWYDGTRWAEDKSNRVFALAKEVVRSIYLEAAAETDEDTKKALVRHAMHSEGVSRVRAMIDLARAELPALPDDFDVYPHLLNLANGTYNLTLDILQPHSAEDRITKLIPIAYDNAAAAPRWHRFLSEIFDGDLGLIDYVQRVVGAALWADRSEHALLICYGNGANGKSVLFETLLALFADYGQSMAAETLLNVRRSAGAPSSDVARLRGARLVTAREPKENACLGEELVKALTGGDTITARHLYSEDFDFQPCFRLWLATNHKPRIVGTDEGIWRRLKLVPFRAQFLGEKADKQLTAKLREELPGILRWALEGAAHFTEHGLKDAPSVVAATAEYRNEEDVVGAWIDERCVLDVSVSTPAVELYDDYARWAGKDALSVTAFGKRLAERGLQRGRTMRVRHWQGIRLTEQQEFDA